MVVTNLKSNIPPDAQPHPECKAKHRELPIDDFSCFKEGDTEPTLGKKIKVLIYHARLFIVYIDNEDFVEWATTDEYGSPHEIVGSVLNRVGYLEARSESLLDPTHVLPFRRLLGESLARALLERKSENALGMLDLAEKYMIARGDERARTWYLSAATIVTMFLTIVLAIIWSRRGSMTTALGENGFQVVIGAGVGSLGALLSIITRSNKISMDASAGWKVHYLESAARVVVGVVGALLVTLAIKANLVLPSNSAANSLPLIMLICIIAGASERLVPNLIKHIESTVTLGDKD
jgi:hypothetical protein